MKFIAYVLFAVSVLLVSAFARAESLMMLPMIRQAASGLPVHIQKIDAIDLAAVKIYVSGTLPNICTADPTPEVSLEGHTLILSLTTPIQMEPCADQVKPFGLVIDLPALARAKGVSLEASAIYELKTPGYGFIMNVSGAELAR